MRKPETAIYQPLGLLYLSEICCALPRVNVDQRVAKIEATLHQFANVMVVTALQDERLISIERPASRWRTTPLAIHRQEMI
jgi:hypothetical protein